MKVYRNLPAIKSREQRGRRIALGGLVILFIGLLASFTPNWFPPDEPAANALAGFVQRYWTVVSFGALAVGFIASNVGSYYINRFAPRRWPGSKRVARPDELVENGLKGFDDKYALFLWGLDDVPYILVGPLGVRVFLVRSDKGTVRVYGDKWRERFSMGRMLMFLNREGLGNPVREIEDTERRVLELLQEGEASGELRVNAADVPIESAAVFINPATQLEIENPSMPVLRVDQLKKYVRTKKDQQLDAGEVRAVTDYLLSVSALA
ncbi:MAG: hypothetical protein OXC27_14075 [Caldilineaceae bacterium]|nr:hypothetical protein [Caldilineaceae bacterium]